MSGESKNCFGLIWWMLWHWTKKRNSDCCGHIYTVGPQYEDKKKISAKNENCDDLVQLPKKIVCQWWSITIIIVSHIHSRFQTVVSRSVADKWVNPTNKCGYIKMGNVEMEKMGEKLWKSIPQMVNSSRSSLADKWDNHINEWSHSVCTCNNVF